MQVDRIGIAKLHITDEQVLSDREVEFLMRTGLAYKICCFMNSTEYGKERHYLKKSELRQTMIRKEGVLTPLKDLIEELIWDEEMQKIRSKDNYEQVWMYRSPDGLVPIDPFHYGNLAPIECLSEEMYKTVMQRAEQFWEQVEEIDIGEKKPCILQVITTKKDESINQIFANYNDALPQHTAIRLIDATGNVYSCGIQMEAGTFTQVCENGDVSDLFATTTAHISIPDYQESTSFAKKLVTSLPITEKRFKNIIDFIVISNTAGVRFHVFHQNCATLARLALSKAGLTALQIPRKISIGEYFGSMLPNNVIDVCRSVATITPRYLGQMCSFIGDAINPVVEKISTLFWNCVCFRFGSWQMKTEFIGQEESFDNSTDFAVFSRSYRDIHDLFNEAHTKFDSHTAVVEWQKKQASTVQYAYDQGPKLYI